LGGRKDRTGPSPEWARVSGKRAAQDQALEHSMLLCGHDDGNWARKRFRQDDVRFVDRKSVSHNCRKLFVTERSIRRIGNHLYVASIAPSIKERLKELSCSVHSWEQYELGHSPGYESLRDNQQLAVVRDALLKDIIAATGKPHPSIASTQEKSPSPAPDALARKPEQPLQQRTRTSVPEHRRLRKRDLQLHICGLPSGCQSLWGRTWQLVSSLPRSPSR